MILSGMVTLVEYLAPVHSYDKHNAGEGVRAIVFGFGSVARELMRLDAEFNWARG